MENWKINENSNIIGQPNKLKLPLRKHQLAMLYRCLTIEKNAYTKKYPYGIISDKAGAGKTAVMISLILADKELYGKTQNLIIVPQNIHTQWLNEFKKFSGEELKVKSFINYDDISRLYFNNSVLKEYDVLVTTVLYYDIIISILEQTGLNIKRLIFDEIDTLSNVIENLETKNFLNKKALTNSNINLIKNKDNVGSKNKIIWFISASFDNNINDKGFTFRKETIPLDKLNEVMCKCEDDFINKYNFELIEPDKIIYNCDDISDEYFNYLSIQQLDYINSLSFQNITSIHNNKIANNSLEAIDIIVGDYYLSIKKLEKTIKELNNNTDITTGVKEQIDKLTKEKTFFEKLILLFHQKNCNEDCDEYNCIIDKIKNFSFYENTKLKKLTNFFKNIDKSKEKILIFSDFTGAFKILSKILLDNDIKYTELNGGNIDLIDKSIDKYKNNDTTVLMIDSSTEGCGINLENTTCILFLHKTSDILYNQIIGRAQRPGRTCKLKIITLLNKNEIV